MNNIGIAHYKMNIRHSDDYCFDINHTVCIEFEESSYTVCEGNLPQLLCLILTGDLGRDVTVTFQTMDDSALCKCYMKMCEQLVAILMMKS